MTRNLRKNTKDIINGYIYVEKYHNLKHDLWHII